MGGQNTRHSANPGGRLLAVWEHSGPVRLEKGTNVIGIMEEALTAVAVQEQVEHYQMNSLHPACGWVHTVVTMDADMDQSWMDAVQQVMINA